ncbi:hypothetical protein HZQ11_13665 [Elizabethkingia anophelis]|uniref:Pycsar effector protein domain-containing protein n=1 Tax=Elizabethkingia anophelis TaxID=1117645 RepID=A0A455ZDU9_9FLAO|nr:MULTISPECIES: hypothetical protein [Elizabethkingia]KUF46137.1 hypothetical protein AS358_10455 [Elizabethkingia anophelis]MCT3644208.1 hypothetical protein [Elizabethkingia anophelis]MCT3650533.1 hypothetical protein [Elizabethkingia anophelis]MCT3656433.1 hypothetical protein [Elizabethkingia anophelis]MCT3657979.1 hypothetical protein [Elizabethkingia anophelis]
MTTLKHEEQLQKLFTSINDWLKFAEAKNLGLLTLTAAFAFGFKQIDFPEDSVIEVVGCYIFLPIIFFSFLSSLISLFPIMVKIEKGHLIKSLISKFSNWIDNETSFENIHYYGYLRNLDEAEFEAKFLNKIGSNDSFTKYEIELSTQILYNSRITWLKYQLFKIGAYFFLLALLLSVILIPFIHYLK